MGLIKGISVTYGASSAEPSIALFAAQPTAWSEDISAYLSSHGYHLSTVTSVDLADPAAGQVSPDVIMAVNPFDGMEYFRAVRTQTDTSLRPLLVLISDNFSGDFPCDWADIILPPVPHYIDYQLRTVLRLRAENAALRQQFLAARSEAAALKDILTKQKRTSDEIEILKNAIVRNVSHELKTPLLQVKSAVSLLAEDIQNQELINYAKGATARLETLVKNITLMGSSLDVNPGPVIVRDTVEYAQRNLGRVWEYRDEAKRIQVNLPDNLPPVMADKQGLATVLQLLMDNALKFSKAAVEVGARVQENKVMLFVRDQGIGIASHHIETIFESFFQIDSSSTRRYGGMGIGLAIVRLILERHNTRIMVESKEGKGSTFSFLLPAVIL